MQENCPTQGTWKGDEKGKSQTGRKTNLMVTKGEKQGDRRDKLGVWD